MLLLRRGNGNACILAQTKMPAEQERGRTLGTGWIGALKYQIAGMRSRNHPGHQNSLWPWELHIIMEALRPLNLFNGSSRSCSCHSAVFYPFFCYFLWLLVTTRSFSYFCLYSKVINGSHLTDGGWRGFHMQIQRAVHLHFKRISSLTTLNPSSRIRTAQ